jgi:fumarate reductase (CoM/CoB) subunit B
MDEAEEESMKKQQWVTLRVSRYNPDIDDRHWFQTYQIPSVEGMTLLDALLYIYNTLDATLAYQWNCRSGQCGACAVIVNAKPRLSCRMALKPGETYSIAPLLHFPVIRDLVVDLHRGTRRVEKIRPYIVRVTPPRRPEKLASEDMVDVMHLRSCIQCFACVSACPTIAEAWQEFIGPAGMAKLAGLQLDPRDMENRLQLAFINGLYDCTSCGTCRDVCIPRHIDIPGKAIEKLRALAVEEGLGPAPGHEQLVRNLQEHGSAFEEAPVSLIAQLPDRIDAVDPVDEVNLFPGCLINTRLQEAGRNLIEVLRRNRVTVHIPKTVVCCGGPAFRTGLTKIAEDLVLQNVEYFERVDAKKIVGLCANCMGTIKTDWPVVLRRLGRNPYTFKPLDITDYLVNDLGISRLSTDDMQPINLSVTYHDPCQLRIQQGIWEEPRRLIHLIPGLRLIESEQSDRCCGAGGGMREARRPLSLAVGRRKIELLSKTGADIFATSCSFCTDHLKEVSSMLGLQQEICNVTDLLARSYTRASTR